MKKKVSTPIVIKKEFKSVFNESIPIPDGLVTNESIRQKFIDILKKSNLIPSGALTHIWKLIDAQIIVPVNNKKKGLLGFLNSKLKKSCVPYSFDKYTMGFYSGVTNRIYIIVDNIFANSGLLQGNSRVTKTLIHELQHMQGHNFPSEFFNLHKKLIVDFYYTFFEISGASDKLKVDRDAVEQYAKYILYMFDDIFSSRGGTLNNADLQSYYSRCLYVYHDNFKGDKVPQLAKNIANCVISSVISLIQGKYFDEARKSSTAERLLYIMYYNTYKKIGMDPAKLQSFFGQEAYVPTEIVAMLPQIKITPSLFAFVNRLG